MTAVTTLVGVLADVPPDAGLFTVLPLQDELSRLLGARVDVVVPDTALRTDVEHDAVPL